MHSSITTHLVNEYLLDEPAGVWGQNLPAFEERLGNEEVKARIENLYFAYLFVLRAVMKAGPYLESVQYQTGLPQEDANTLGLVQDLVSGHHLHVEHTLLQNVSPCFICLLHLCSG